MGVRPCHREKNKKRGQATKLGSGLVFCFLPLLIQTPFILMHYIAYDPALFINGKRSVAESHTEDRKYLCRFHPCNEILKRLYEIFETGKKQDLTPFNVL